MQNKILYMLAETSIHPGSGQSSSFVDLPVSRETITEFPYISSTSLKGALSSAYYNHKSRDEFFGKSDRMGKIIISDARILFLPIRSLNSPYKWITCKYILERLVRDLARLDRETTIEANLEEIDIEDFNCISAEDGSSVIFLEEREFTIVGGINKKILSYLKGCIPNDNVAKRLETQLVVLSDNDFKWFARYGLSIRARNKLNEENKTSENLWYEENIPMDTVFYSLVFSNDENLLKSFSEELEGKKYIQVGGNESVGQGWFNVTLK
ncbi:MAG: type III-B CRISPR module RAMP protein Cmr4 [Candidatus Hodarchaeales archaeon]